MRLMKLLVLVLALIATLKTSPAQAACTATQPCANGINTVTCSGNSTCSSSPANSGSVTCDGVTTLCPAYCPGSQVCATRSDCYSYCKSVVPPGTPYFTLCANRCCSCNY
ncbi:MAG TPA: hypothetical protein VIW92_08490 [Thermoanaerobaculia bacterium]